ncbi:Tetratricopeptide repeat-containing protein [Tangfeifania diversioriginum]|uniref:Tetratricopeptide repeat-containing protein n=1 Tax=Tangfeifania diversioriginum TaxID=1168035 RepID=A0A1M6JG57_9BACT|nr:tetratricopeptide repeat protein [Tangfeifania diversioriginum]SHJ45698.1 Tetratricopeptide repeat-containing protein [Tangfeifania diversioriginum]
MKRYFSHTIGVLLLLLLVPLFQRCSTEKNTFASRTFHKVTSKYNVYFNGNESLENGLERIEESIENDYTRLLPIYKVSDPSAANLVKSDMDNAVIKASKLIELHSITAKPKRRRRRTRRYQEFASQEEFNPWIDDSYLLMGKAYYYQHNFMAAIDNLSYILRKYPDGDAKYEAYIFLIRSYSELERFAEASEMIQTVQGEPDFPRKLERELAVATADYYMKQEEYNEAIKFIDIALEKTFWRKDKARLQYIEAQLYEEVGKPLLAAEAYEAVTKMNPDYKMAFNAKVNAAGTFSGEGNLEENKKELRKMLRDKKNVEFRDQIYYALGNIQLTEGNRDEAIDSYRSSVATSFNNQFQRAQSAITLADLYFEDLKYREAQAYYDSAMIIIDETYPNYNSLQSKYRSLTNLTDNLMTVEREDSLQQIAQMPEMERESLIARLMREEQERQRNAENLAMQDQRSQGYYRSNRYRMGMGSGQQGAGWYFYNPQTVSYGRVTFRQRWGQRQLEDNWRRSNKGTFTEGEMDEFAQADSAQMEIKVDDPLKKEFYTQDLPLTDSLMEISHQRIIDALYNAGKIYKSEFSNYERSAEAFEELIERYPENDYVLSSYFDLYDLYELMGNTERANYYRNLIISQFPDSKYAQYLTNPNFFVEMEARTDSLNSLYEQTFQSYRSGNYRNVISLTNSMKELEPDSVVLPKIDFMGTIAQGTQTDIHNFESLLENYIQQYPAAEPTPLATEILTLIQDSTLADYQKLVDMGYINEEIQNEEVLMEDRMEDDEFGGKFSYEEDLLHYFVIAYPRSADIDMNRLRFDIANYNIDHYTRKDFDIETENLNEELSLVVVRALENKENGVIYHRAIIRNAPVFQTLSDGDYVNFAISSTNYRQILSEQSIADYLKFFVKNYSRYIGSDFSDEAPELSPEEMMAKAREEEEMLRERGEFVVVETGAGQEGLFTTDIDTTQLFVLAVKDLGLSMRQALRGFAEFNRNEFRSWNLGQELQTSGDYQLLIVQGIPSLNESMSYFRSVVLNRDLFEPLGRTTYRNFLITEENLETLMEEENVDDYIGFFRNNYVNRDQSQRGATETRATEPVEAAETTETEQVVQEEPEEYTGPYNLEIEKPHLFVFVIPIEGVQKAEFISGIEQFNSLSDDSLNLVIEEQPLDEFRENIVVSGFPDKETATRYFRTVVQNRDLFTPLGQGSYRNFLITEENFGIFMEEKNITDYMDFYKQIYLGE